MSSWVIALLLAAGGGTLAWNKTMHSTNRHDTAMTLGIIAGIIIFLVVFTFLKYILGI